MIGGIGSPIGGTPIGGTPNGSTALVYAGSFNIVYVVAENRTVYAIDK
jgi:hypothetical protein